MASIQINQKQDALFQEPSKNKKEELLEVINKRIEKRRFGR
jgi:hypothetical protein